GRGGARRRALVHRPLHEPRRDDVRVAVARERPARRARRGAARRVPLRRATEPILPLELFRNRTFSVTSIIGFIIGLALFGAVTYLPVFLQIVKGRTPTASGLLLTPMMGGLLITSIASGRLISRFGRYRAFPIVGTAVMTVAMYLLSRLDVGTTSVYTGVSMAVLGLGLGMVMQVLVLAVQNDVDPRNMGVATSGSLLFR